MEIIFHSHHADISDYMRKRAARAVERAAARFPRIVEAIIRFETDGPRRRVTVTLRAPKHHDIMGTAEGKFWGPSLTQAIAKVLKQANRERSSTGHARSRQRARANAKAGR